VLVSAFDPATTLLRALPDASEEQRRALYARYGLDVPAHEIRALWAAHAEAARVRGARSREEDADDMRKKPRRPKHRPPPLTHNPAT
jgi:hypothetical protein